MTNNIIKYQSLINGELYENGNWISVINPTTNKIAGQVPALTKVEIKKVYEFAKFAQKNWEQMPILKRISFLNSWKQLIIRDKLILAELMTNEIAKGTKAACSEIDRTVEYIEYTLQEALRLHPESYTGDSWGSMNKLAIFEYVPKGIVLAISPFNYPINLSVSKIFPALVTGNSVVFKPATQGSLVGLHLAKLAKEANIPNGVFNAISGKGSEIGDSLVENEAINVISFTGSAVVGNRISQKSLKADLILELGGKDPAIVLNDADLEDTATKIIKGAFSYSGQRCTAIKRVLVQRTISSKLIPILKEKVEKLTVGLPTDDCDITPVIDQPTVDNAKKLIKDALDKGANCLIGNKFKENLMWPTIITDVTTKMNLAWEEPFAPLLPIIIFDEVKEAINITNDSQYGLQASVFTTNINSAMSIGKLLEVGSVNINDQSQRGPDHFSFVGVKDSGLGVQGIRPSLLAFTRPKGIVINWKTKI
ncbi:MULTISPECIES: NADP-dependent glyceraldehyde-3-phosphate dehydrogenase [unclassified Spiroplasma]|uniref:NADP-dependent glyceraldehyde-3-phosphate dehydrogenase n=1 Tax=unclassified Spiroplasma TaxID=2637901 RepID=UPI0030CBA47D